MRGEVILLPLFSRDPGRLLDSSSHAFKSTEVFEVNEVVFEKALHMLDPLLVENEEACQVDEEMSALTDELGLSKPVHAESGKRTELDPSAWCGG